LTDIYNIKVLAPDHIPGYENSSDSIEQLIDNQVEIKKKNLRPQNPVGTV